MDELMNLVIADESPSEISDSIKTNYLQRLLKEQMPLSLRLQMRCQVMKLNLRKMQKQLVNLIMLKKPKRKSKWHINLQALVLVFATNQTSASQTFTVQSDTLRVVAKNAGQHVAIGTTGPATTTDYYVPANSSATLNLGRVSSIGVAGITKGAATVITLPEGMGNPFKVNDVIVISGVTGVTGFNTTAKQFLFKKLEPEVLHNLVQN